MRASMTLVGLNLIAWLVIAFGAGWWHRRTPIEALRTDGFVLGLRRFESSGDWYERRLLIKRWKSRLPETGGRGGGMSKKRLPGRSRADLERFAAECRRGERTHWTIVVVTPVLLVWNSVSDVVAIAVANALGNAPFLAALRYNRARIVSALERRPADPSTGADGEAGTAAGGETEQA